MELSSTRHKVLKWLDDRGIPYEYYEHPRAHSIEDCLRMPFITENVTICRNILLCNRQQTSFYLLLLRPLTPFRTSIVSKLLHSSRLSFAPEEALEQKLQLSSGSVSPLGLLFDSTIPLCFEKEIRNTPRIAFHPCDNAATVIFTQEVFWNLVVPALGTDTIELENIAG